MRWYEYKMEVDDLQASEDLKARLLAMQSQKTASAAPEKKAVRKKPEELRPQKAIRFPSRRVWKGLAACAAFCVIAGGAASLLHMGSIGVGGSARSMSAADFSTGAGNNVENSISSYAMASAPAMADYAVDSGNSLRSSGSSDGTAMLTSGELESAEESARAEEDSKIIYTTNLTLESKDYDGARAALDAALQEAGGYLESSDEYSNSGSSRSISLTLRVPQENYESFLTAVAEAGNVTYKSQQAEDVTTQYMDVEARLDSLKEQRDRLQELKASADNLSDLLQIESSLSDVQYQLESYQSQLDWYSRQVECCTVYLSLEEVQTYTPADDGFGTRLLDALQSGWSGFVSAVQAAVVAIVGAWPFVVLVAACGAVYGIIRRRRAKKQK